MDGWIKLHRDIFRHWIFEDAEYFKAWLYIVGNAAFNETRQKVGKKIISVKRGEFIASEKQLCEVFNWGTTRLRNFIDNLIDENMLKKEIVNKKSKFIIVKYELYQNTESDNKVISEQKQSENKVIKKQKQSNNTLTKEEIKKEKNITLLSKVIEDFKISEDFIKIFENWFEYKKARKESYKTDTSIVAFCRKLIGISGSSAEIAEKIIEQSMANNWAGIFQLKNSSKFVKNNDDIEVDYEKLSR